MAIDVEAEFRRGGPVVLAFLTYCVMAYRLEPLLAWLVRDYRLRPTAPGALAIWDCFLAAGSPARLRYAPPALLPPRELRLLHEMERIRTVSDGASLRIAAPRHLFDPVISGLRGGDADLVLGPGGAFDPTRTPEENLPGGRMSPAQASWVEQTWQKGVRPRLVAAGFWRVATVG